MKQCPLCSRNYTDEGLMFCLDDGTRLSSTSYDPQATLALPQPRITSTTPTVASPPQVLQPQVIRQGVRPSIVYALIALLALVIGGAAVALFYERGKGSATVDGNKQNEKPVVSPTPAQTEVGNKAQPEDQPTPQRTPEREKTNSAVPGKYPEGSTRLLGPEDVMGKSLWELKIMKNEIYARHGYIFKSPELRTYFESQPWYRPLYEDVTDIISDLERENAAFIKGYE
jgi:hypothetical protein